MTSNAKEILRKIKQQSTPFYEWKEDQEILDLVNDVQNEDEYPRPYPPSADDWQRFLANFVEEYGGEVVQPTGMTHSMFIKYICSAGFRENDEPEIKVARHIIDHDRRDFISSWEDPKDRPAKLREILKKMFNEDDT